MKLIAGIIIGIVVALSVGTAYAGNEGKLLATITGRGTFNNEVHLTRVNDGSVNCYIVTAKQQSSSAWLSGTTVSVSCVKVK